MMCCTHCICRSTCQKQKEGRLTCEGSRRFQSPPQLIQKQMRINFRLSYCLANGQIRTGNYLDFACFLLFQEVILWRRYPVAVSDIDVARPAVIHTIGVISC